MRDPGYVVITPVRNEAAFVGRTIRSMAAQTLVPAQWVIVDDGSTDGTGAVLDEASRRHDWMTVVHRPDRGFRKSGGGVVEAFYDGFAALSGEPWDFLVKLDGDLAFEPDYFARCFARFGDDDRLGLGGGAIHVAAEGTTRIESPGDPPFHVRGATKIYRRACWEEIQPLVRGPGWDTIDEVRANMKGWRTATFNDVPIFQQRSTGSVDGTWANWFKNGRANYITGYHPLFMFAKCIKRSWSKPRLIGALALWAGFCSGYVRRQPRMADAPSVCYLRQQQLRYMLMQPSIYRPRT